MTIARYDNCQAVKLHKKLMSNSSIRRSRKKFQSDTKTTKLPQYNICKYNTVKTVPMSHQVFVKAQQSVKVQQFS